MPETLTLSTPIPSASANLHSESPSEIAELTFHDVTPVDRRSIAKASRDRSTLVANMRLISILADVPLSVVEELTIDDLNAAAALVIAGPLLAAVASAAAAFIMLGLTIAATPFGWIGLAIAGVVAAITAAAGLIYLSWRPITAFFKGLWDDVIKIFETAWARIQPIIDGLKFAWNLPGRAVTAAGDTFRGMVSRPPQPGDAVDPTTGLRLPGPRLYGPGGAASAPGAGGDLHVKVDIGNLPPGSKVATSSSGAVVPEVNVGHAFGADLAGAY